ncbi:MAG: hypothetical protein JWR69_4489 [Pedosphaera sp.]|nr:hypothetical protein [Pedosphaera sp.]
MWLQGNSVTGVTTKSTPGMVPRYLNERHVQLSQGHHKLRLQRELWKRAKIPRIRPKFPVLFCKGL